MNTGFKIENLLKGSDEGKGKEKKENIINSVRRREMEAMGYSFDKNGKVLKDKNGDPILNKDCENVVDGKNYEDIKIEDTSEEEIAEYVKYMDDFLKEEKIGEEEKSSKDQDFEDQDILGDALKKTRREMEKLKKNLPEISQEEKEMMLKDFPRLLKALVHKKKLEKEDISEKAASELIKEVMDNFPSDYVKLIHGKLIPKIKEYNWKKETFKGKEIFVSCYPNEENPVIKYIHKNPKEKTDIFFAQTKNKKGNIMKAEKGKGPLLVFLGY
jgi:hypothetical protein